MAAYRRVYDSRHLQADCQERDQLQNPTLGNRVWAIFTFFTGQVRYWSLTSLNITQMISDNQRRVYFEINLHIIFI